MSAENLTILFVILIVIYLFSILITTLKGSQKSEGDRRGATKNAVLYGEKLNLTVSDMSSLNDFHGLENRCNCLAVKILNVIAPKSFYEINFNYWTNEKIEEFIANSVSHLKTSGVKVTYNLTHFHVMKVINQVRNSCQI